MKVCDLTQAYNSGGIRTYIDAKRKHLLEQTDWEHLLISPGEKDTSHQKDRSTWYQVASPLVPKCEPYRFILRLDKVMSILMKEKPDLIEFASPYLLPWVAYSYRKRLQKRVVGYFHTDFPTAYVKPTIEGLAGKWVGKRSQVISSWYAKVIYKKCDAVLTASKVHYHKLIDMGISSVKRVSLGVDLELFNPTKKSSVVRKQFGVNDSDILLIYAGRFDHEKRVMVIADAIQKIPKTKPIKILFLGEGPFRELLQQYAENDHRMSILPYQSNKQELAKLLASADIYVTAGPYETFALSVVEAQASGLPVVGVKAGALVERIPPSVGVLGAVDSADEMAQNIEYLVQNGFREKGRNARQIVESNFSWDNTFNNIFEIYENLIVEPRVYLSSKLT